MNNFYGLFDEVSSTTVQIGTNHFLLFLSKSKVVAILTNYQANDLGMLVWGRVIFLGTEHTHNILVLTPTGVRITAAAVVRGTHLKVLPLVLSNLVTHGSDHPVGIPMRGGPVTPLGRGNSAHSILSTASSEDPQGEVPWALLFGIGDDEEQEEVSSLNSSIQHSGAQAFNSAFQQISEEDDEEQEEVVAAPQPPAQDPGGNTRPPSRGAGSRTSYV